MSAHPRDQFLGPPVHRLIGFADAVVAIAITLLALPVMEAVPDAAVRHLTTAEFFAETGDRWIALAISFFVIATLWYTHHSLFSHIKTAHPLLVWLTILWLFTIVVLSVTTAMIGSSLVTDAPQKLLYIGTMLASSGCITAMYLFTDRRPAVWSELGKPSIEGESAAIAQLVLTSLALVTALLVNVGYLVMFLLMGVGPLGSLIVRWRRRTAHEAGTR